MKNKFTDEILALLEEKDINKLLPQNIPTEILKELSVAFEIILGQNENDNVEYKNAFVMTIALLMMYPNNEIISIPQKFMISAFVEQNEQKVVENMELFGEAVNFELYQREGNLLEKYEWNLSNVFTPIKF